MTTVQLGDLCMFYEKMGIGEPIIFLHSSYSRGILAFAGQLLDFQKKYTCYYPDFRGHGKTTCENLKWSTPQLAEDIIHFMNALNITKAHFVGFSLGANVGLYCAVTDPERVATLTTIGTSGFVDPSGAEEFEPEWLIEKGKVGVIDQMIERHEEAHSGDWQTFMRESAKDWRLYPQLSKEQLASIRCGSLFISGENDPFGGEEKIKYLNSLVKGSRYLLIEGCSHSPHMVRENPVYVNDSILDFISSNPITAE